MTYSGEFLKITWQFTVQASDEIADTSLCYTTAPGWTGAVAALAELEDATLVDIRNAYDDFMTAAGVVGLLWADYSQLRSIKVAAISTAGVYLTEPRVSETDTPPEGTASYVTPQSTVVLSLRSGFTIGGGNYGRMYLPHTLMPMTTNTPAAGTGTASAIADAGADFVNAVTTSINADTTAIVFPAIMSQGSGAGVTPVRSPSGKGVTTVGVGTINDTQRRRRNGLAENTQFATLA